MKERGSEMIRDNLMEARWRYIDGVVGRKMALAESPQAQRAWCLEWPEHSDT